MSAVKVVPMANRTAGIGIVAVAAIVLICCLRGEAALPAYAQPGPSRHDGCISPSAGALGQVELRNRCRESIDVKWCYMRQDGSDRDCVITRTLSPNFRVSTPTCHRCTYKVLWQAFRSADRVLARFGSDAAMFERLQGS